MDIDQRLQELNNLLTDALRQKAQMNLAIAKINGQIELLKEIQKTGIKKKKNKSSVEKSGNVV